MTTEIKLIDASYPSGDQPKHTKFPLWEHQKKMLARCIEIESIFGNLKPTKTYKTKDREIIAERDSIIRNINMVNELRETDPETASRFQHIETVPSDDVFFEENFGIMCDKPGVGKTITTLSLILSDLDKNKCNLIVVPQNIFTQWDKTIKSFCDLENVNYKSFTDYSSIIPLYSNPDILKETNIILITSLYYNIISSIVNSFNAKDKHKKSKTNDFIVDRVFYDEIDSIEGMLRDPIKSKFTWFISASYKDDKIGCYMIHNSAGRSCKCDDKLIEDSLKLKEPNNMIYKCKSVFTELIKDFVSSKKLNELNALDFNTNIYKIVKVVPKNEKDFVGLLLCDIEERLKFSKNNIETLNSVKVETEECGFYTGDVLKKKIDFIEEQIKESENDILTANELKLNILNSLKQYSICPLSLNDLDGIPNVISKCCKTFYCKDTIKKVSKIKCFACNSEVVYPEGFEVFPDNVVCSVNVIKEKLKYKIDVCKDVINGMTPESKVIIFSDYPEVFKTIEMYFEEKSIKVSILDGGSIDSIDKLVLDYKEGNSMFLLADSSLYGSGMNLENTTDIIFIHKINEELEKQVIGRAQRPGRVSVLKIHRLLHPNEL